MDLTKAEDVIGLWTLAKRYRPRIRLRDPDGKSHCQPIGLAVERACRVRLHQRRQNDRQVRKVIEGSVGEDDKNDVQLVESDFQDCRACRNNVPKLSHEHTRDAHNGRQSTGEAIPGTCPRNGVYRPRTDDSHILEVSKYVSLVRCADTSCDSIEIRKQQTTRSTSCGTGGQSFWRS